MIENESALNEWKWNNYLVETPEGFDTLPDLIIFQIE